MHASEKDALSGTSACKHLSEYFFSFSFYTRMRNKYCVPLLDSKALNNLIHEILRPGQGLMRPFFKHEHITREVCRTILVKQLPKLKERFYSELFFLFFFFFWLCSEVMSSLLELVEKYWDILHRTFHMNIDLILWHILIPTAILPKLMKIVNA